MILTDDNINALLVRLAKQQALDQSDQVQVETEGWTLTIRYEGVINADLRDCFDQPVRIPSDFMKDIEDGILTMLEL